jgi:uncharacterized membrane protein HdeD (DUF308 family)
MFEKILNNWWLYALRGLVAVIFGSLALAMPKEAMQVLVLVFGAFALADGILTLVAGFSLAPFFSRWWMLLLEGAAGVGVGLMAIFMPSITARALVYLIGSWAVITGILQIVTAIEFRKVLTGEWTLVFGGLLSIAIGVLLFVFPVAGEVSVLWIIGAYAVIDGISEMIFGFRLHNLSNTVKTAVTASR